MYYYDDYPCARCPYNEPAYGHCAYDEYCQYEEEEMEQQCYVDTCDDDEDDASDDNESDDNDAPPAIVIIPRPSDDLDDLPFLSLIHAVPRPRLSSHDWDYCANEGEEDDDYDPYDYPEDDDEDEEYDTGDYTAYYDDEYYDSDDDSLTIASSPKAIIPLDDYLF